MEYEQLKIENQICFPLYAASRLIIRNYQPYLKKLDITYPQYLVLLVLWENDNLTIVEISKKLYLNTNTLTPLLKRLEKQNIISKTRISDDERKVKISLTKKGFDMKDLASTIPFDIVNELDTNLFSKEELINLKNSLDKFLRLFDNTN